MPSVRQAGNLGDIMTLFQVGVTLYSSIAIGFLTATYIEGRWQAAGWDLARVSGLLACLAWPVLLIIVLRNTHLRAR